MTGMKEGAGEDPFAEDTTSTTNESTSAVEQDTTTDPVTEQTADTSKADTSPAETSAPDTAGTTQDDRAEGMQIPYKFRRDGVKEGRDRVPLFLQAKTKSDERDALRELEDRFDDDVSLTDLREALVITGMGHLDEVEGVLEEWGYGMTFD